MKNPLYEKYLSSHSTLKNVDNYDFMAGYYEKNFLDLLGNKEHQILEIACGAGHFLYFLKKFGFKNVRALDLCQECVDLCVKNEVVEQDRIVKGEALDFLRQNDDLFNIIVMNDVIEHLDKERIVETLAAAHQRLQKDGRLIIKVVNAANPITGASSRYGDFTHAIGFTQESLSQVLRMAGFDQVEIRAQNIWVFNPLINLAGRALQGMFNLLFRALFLLYGRKTTTIFTKDIIAVAKR